MLPVITEYLMGLAITLAGSELLLRGSVSLAKRRRAAAATLNLFALLAGLAVPLLYIPWHAAANGSPDMAQGMAVGIIFFLLLLLPGCLAYIRPFAIQGAAKHDALWLIAAAAALALFSADGQWTPWEGSLLLAGFVGYMLRIYEQAERPESLEDITTTTDCAWCASAYLCIGFGLVSTGADILIDATAWAARSAGISEAVAGRFCGGVALAAPALMACLTAMRKKREALIMPVLLGLAVCGMVAGPGILAATGPVALKADMQTDTWLVLAASALLAPWIRLRGRLSMREGVVLIALFAAYGVYSLGF